MTFFDLLQYSPLSFVVLSTALGLTVGSFLNVVIYRLPKMMEREWAEQCAALNRKEGEEEPAPPPPYNLVIPRSACPSCGHMIRAWENIPVISWLALRGRCAHCKAPISARYPIVEAITGCLSGFAAWHFGFGMAAGAALLLVWALVALTFIDFDTQLLPDSITLPLLWLGLLLNLNGAFTSLPNALIGAVAGYLVLWCVLGIQAHDRKRGHGLWRLQIARRARCMARMDDVAADHPAFFAGGCCGRNRSDRVRQTWP